MLCSARGDCGRALGGVQSWPDFKWLYCCEKFVRPRVFSGPARSSFWRVHLSGSGKFGSFGQGASCHVLAALLVVCNQNFTRKLVSNWRVSAIGFRNVNYHIISNQ